MDDAYSNKATTPRDRKSTIESLKNENMNYIDSSDVIVEYYKNQNATGLDRYFIEIEEWLEQDRGLHDNTPLVLEADDGIGKKTLLVKWMEYHAHNKKGRYPDFIIPHFATQSGKNSNYFYAIYRILIKLRETLNIRQKVELLEEKLRRYFSYWLEICGRELEQQILNGAEVIYDKVILIFEGIDNFRDMMDLHREANVSFWLPKYFPKNIKVIVTAEKNSQAMAILRSSSHIIPVVCDQKIIKQIVNNHLAKSSFVLENRLKYYEDLFITLLYRVRNQPLFVKTYFSVFVPHPSDGLVDIKDVDIQQIDKILTQTQEEQKYLQNIQTVEQLFEYILSYYSTRNIFNTKETFIKLVTVLAITQKGLTYKELQAVCGFEEKQWKTFVVFFKVFLMKHRDLWIIHNEMLKKVLIKVYYNEETYQLHNEIADVISKLTQNSIRKLEEETFHLLMGRNYFLLKETISIIENFLLLFNPNNKYDLCRYWQQLEEHGFDPVLEYNKAIEGFQIHYHPSAEDIFRIIIQVSRFLKEFGDFETKNTPSFRHPPIIGTLQELYDIGLLNEILKLDLYYNKDPEYQNFNPAIHLKRVSKPIKASVLSKMESQNVEIAVNREELRNHYLKLITKEDEFTEQEDTDVIDTLDIDNFNALLEHKLRKVLNRKDEQLSAVEVDDGERVSTDYYYKRWIWIQFPWACMSINKSCDYSVIIKHCFSSATDYMSVEEEHAYTNTALKMAIEAKLKKKQMYESNFDDSQPLMLIPQTTILQQKQQPLQQYTEQSGDSVVFDRSIISLPQLQLPASQHTGKEKYDRYMFITQDFLSLDTLNKETKQVRSTQSYPVLDGKNTLKLLDKGKEQKNRIKFYASNSLSLSSYQPTEIFPILKGDITKHTQKQLYLLEKQAKEMRKKLDGLVYENLKVSKELKMQKILAYNKGYIKKEMATIEDRKQLETDLKVRLHHAEKDHKKSTKAKYRVQTLLKICKDNKQQNEEWIRHLNYLIGNFKKLIKFEESDITKNKQHIQTMYKTIDDFLLTYNQKKQHQRDLILQISRSLAQKREIDQMFQNADTQIQESAFNSVQTLRRKQAHQDTAQEFKKKKQQSEKNSKTVVDKIAAYDKQYQQIKATFDIKEQGYVQSAKFQDFMNNVEKKSELQIILSQQRQKLNEVEIKKQRLQEQLKTYQNAYQFTSQSSISQQDNIHTDEQKLEDQNIQSLVDTSKRFQQIKLICETSYESLFVKLKAKELPQLLEQLKLQRQSIVQNVNAQAYQQIVTQKYDMDAVYMKVAPFAQPVQNEQ